MAKTTRVEHVVVDTVAFFRNVQLQDIAENVHTLQVVVNEIRDKSTRERLAVLPYELKFREPSTECIQFVSNFARKTGDYQSLSAVDIRVLALAYQLTKEHVGTDHLKKEPEKKVTYSASKKPLESVKDIAGFYYPSKQVDDKVSVLTSSHSDDLQKSEPADVELELTSIQEKDGTVVENSAEKSQDVVADHKQSARTSESEEKNEGGGAMDGVEKDKEKEEEQGEEEEEGRAERDQSENLSPKSSSVDEVFDGEQDEPVEEGVDQQDGDEGKTEDGGGDDADGDEDVDDDEAGWITPHNISQVKQQMGVKDEASLEGIRVGCMTSDFAMQNVLIQIGIPVISVNGMLIKRAKSFVLRCHDCFKVTHDMSKIFCPKCGNKSLDKVTVTVDEDGTQRYHMSRRRPPNTRGMRYALPKPQGGKHATNPILFADQHVPHNRESRKARQRTNVFDPDYEAMTSPFATHDVTSRSAQLGVRHIGGQGSGPRRNPNDNRQQKKKGKRR
ncbi:RNA-binding protein NOB1-like [Diadema setosum]|uniref:RNA-binding protein NOB1-like n=1 Tax=Diadema setosum TaxID=31175 RepID=UPI003B3AFC9A